MQSGKANVLGFTLVAALQLLVLLSGFSIGLLMMVNTEQRVGGYDLNNTYAYHAAEGAMEKPSSDLGNMFKTIQAPTAGQICALSNNYPSWDPTATYPVYNVAPVSGCSAPQVTVWGPVSSGTNQGLYAQIIPVIMNASVQRTGGETGINPVPSANGPCANGDTRFVAPPYVLSDAVATQAAAQAEWPLINGWLLVEAKWADGKWHGITKEWLGLGFGRGLAVPTAGPRRRFLVAPGRGAT